MTFEATIHIRQRTNPPIAGGTAITDIEARVCLPPAICRPLNLPAESVFGYSFAAASITTEERDHALCKMALGFEDEHPILASVFAEAVFFRMKCGIGGVLLCPGADPVHTMIRCDPSTEEFYTEHRAAIDRFGPADWVGRFTKADRDWNAPAATFSPMAYIQSLEGSAVPNQFQQSLIESLERAMNSPNTFTTAPQEEQPEIANVTVESIRQAAAHIDRGFQFVGIDWARTPSITIAPAPRGGFTCSYIISNATRPLSRGDLVVADDVHGPNSYGDDALIDRYRRATQQAIDQDREQREIRERTLQPGELGVTRNMEHAETDEDFDARMDRLGAELRTMKADMGEPAPEPGPVPLDQADDRALSEALGAGGLEEALDETPEGLANHGVLVEHFGHDVEPPEWAEPIGKPNPKTPNYRTV